MKILTREQFLALKGQVLYAKYTPISFDKLCVKLGNVTSITSPYTVPNDFVYDRLVQVSHDGWERLFEDAMMDRNPDPSVSVEINLNNSTSDGLFEDEQLFAVYERKDVLALISRLLEVQNNMPEV